MNADEFRHRRAKAGKGEERKNALFELRMAHSMLDHAIIGYGAGDPKGEEKQAAARADIEKYVALLLDITHPYRPPFDEGEFFLGSIKESA